MKKLVLLSLFILVLSGSLFAQLSTATINGTVVDSSGAVVTKAQITVTNPATGFSRETVSGAAGRLQYSLSTGRQLRHEGASSGLLDCSAKRNSAGGRPGNYG